jgi:hypothetical protein
MKKIILMILTIAIVATISILHYLYKDNQTLIYLNSLLRILLVVAIIRFIINKRKTTTP